MAAAKRGAKKAAKSEKAEKAKGNEYVFQDVKTPAQREKERQLLFKKFKGDHQNPPLLRTADKVSSTYLLRRPTGITQLDVDLGGGFPSGGLCCLSGIDNAGKSTLLYLTCAMHQRIYGNNSSIAASLVEGNPDYLYMRSLGFMVAVPDSMIKQMEDDRKDRGLPPMTKEERAHLKKQIGHVDLILGETGEEVMHVLYTAIKANVYGIVALDSVSALQSASLASRPDFEKGAQQAANANLLTNFMLKYYPCMNGLWGKNQTTVLFTQQMRANRSKSNALPHLQKYLPDFEVQGANALKHGKLIDISLAKGKKEKEKKTSDDDNDKKATLGRSISYRLVKGKAGTHDEIVGEFDNSYEHGYQQSRTVLVTGIRYGAIQEKQGLITVLRKPSPEFTPDPIVIDIPAAEFLKRLDDDIEFDLLVRREVMAFAGKECIYREAM